MPSRDAMNGADARGRVDAVGGDGSASVATDPVGAAGSREAPAGARVAHVALPVADLDRALAFYVGALGLRKLPRPDFGVAGAWLTGGGAQLHLVQSDDAVAVPMPRHMAFAVPAGRIGEVVSAVAAAGGSVVRPPSSREDFGREVWTAFCTDPEGNAVELTDLAVD